METKQGRCDPSAVGPRLQEIFICCFLSDDGCVVKEDDTSAYTSIAMIGTSLTLADERTTFPGYSLEQTRSQTWRWHRPQPSSGA